MFHLLLLQILIDALSLHIFHGFSFIFFSFLPTFRWHCCETIYFIWIGKNILTYIFYWFWRYLGEEEAAFLNFYREGAEKVTKVRFNSFSGYLQEFESIAFFVYHVTCYLWNVWNCVCGSDSTLMMTVRNGVWQIMMHEPFVSRLWMDG